MFTECVCVCVWCFRVRFGCDCYIAPRKCLLTGIGQHGALFPSRNGEAWDISGRSRWVSWPAEVVASTSCAPVSRGVDGFLANLDVFDEPHLVTSVVLLSTSLAMVVNSEQCTSREQCTNREHGGMSREQRTNSEQCTNSEQGMSREHCTNSEQCTNSEH